MIAGAQVVWINGVKWRPRQFSPKYILILEMAQTYCVGLRWQVIVIGPSDFILTKNRQEL